MHPQRSIFLILLLGLSVGCASAPGDYAGRRDINQDALAQISAALEKSDNVVVKTSDGVLICSNEQVTGSHIPEVICLTPQQMERVRHQSVEMLDMQQRMQSRKTSSM